MNFIVFKKFRYILKFSQLEKNVKVCKSFNKSLRTADSGIDSTFLLLFFRREN